MKPDHIKKLYYSIQEVSELTSVKKHVLRYWENEFAQLRPSKNRAGNRTYRESDIKTIFLIKHLLYEEHFTIEKAKQRIAELKKNGAEHQNRSLQDLKREDLLLEIRREVNEALALIDEVLPKASQDSPQKK